MQMEIIESYNKTELSGMENTPRSRIDKDKHLYIPVKIVTAQSRATQRWYTVRYMKTKDVEKFIENHKKTWKKK